MSAIDLANYIQKRMKALDLTIISAAERSGISRQTWHKLRQADIKEAKISTLMKVADTLHTTPTYLFDLYFHNTSSYHKYSSKQEISQSC